MDRCFRNRIKSGNHAGKLLQLDSRTIWVAPDGIHEFMPGETTSATVHPYLENFTGSAIFRRQNGEIVIAGQLGNELAVMNFSTGVVVSSGVAMTGEILIGCCAEDESGNCFLSASDGHSVRLWDMGRNQIETVHQSDTTVFAPQLIFHPHCRTFALVWGEADERIYWLEYGAKKAVVVACDGYFPMMVPYDGGYVLTYLSHYSYVQAIHFSPDALPEVTPGRVRSQVFQDDPRFAYALSQSPVLVTMHKVPTVFWSDLSRHELFFSRFLGENWGPILSVPGIVNADGANYPLSRQIAAIAVGVGAEQILLIPSDTGCAPRLSKPVWPNVDERDYRFFDLLNCERLENLVRKGEVGRKHPANPLIERGESGSFNARLAVNHGSFFRLGKGEGFRAVFTGVGENGCGFFDWWNHLPFAAASSMDGVSWCIDGRSEGLKAPLAVMFDEAENDPERRYKGVHFIIAGAKEMAAQNRELDNDSEEVPGWLFTSGDGKNFVRQDITLHYGEVMYLEHCPMNLLFDPADTDGKRRWKAYGYASISLGRRACTLAYSPDLIHWEMAPCVALPPERCASPWIATGARSQVHGMIVERLGAGYVGITHYQDNYDRLWLELAWSNDGLHFDPIEPGKRLIAAGGENDWDRDVQTPLNLEMDENEWRIYYSGTNKVQETSSVGVAFFAPESLSFLELQDGSREARLVLSPFVHQRSGEVAVAITSVNADCHVCFRREDGAVFAAEMVPEGVFQIEIEIRAAQPGSTVRINRIQIFD